jgi:hypothetical protein
VALSGDAATLEGEAVVDARLYEAVGSTRSVSIGASLETVSFTLEAFAM